MKEFTVKIKPLTPIWTGDENRRCSTLRETGIIGSLRWWYEALIRGLGGSACDPTDENSRCKFSQDKWKEAIKFGKTEQEALNEQICPTCQLFGCTGWARKFRLEVEKRNDNEIVFRFIDLREVKDIEWALLDKAIQIIAKYGAIGGKLAEREYGIIQIEKNDLSKFSLKKDELQNYLKEDKKGYDNPNLLRFIFIDGKNLNSEIVGEIASLPFLKGTKNKGKKYFYKTIDNKANRLFAYTESDKEYIQLIELLRRKSIRYIEGKNLLIWRLK
ncbi:MAG: type III-B CRISPR module RAMP protein Cmr1 [Candidatus Nanoarchaeia archaeon]|nr:type III-B CRISPR module RAMP protein Cmr1 [Candidatus Jingweiarchaeum tengchongense]